MSGPDCLPRFTGTFRYETEFEWGESANGALLELGEVYETAEVLLNGEHIGVRICPPYRLEIGDLLKKGKNSHRSYEYVGERSERLFVVLCAAGPHRSDRTCSGDPCQVDVVLKTVVEGRTRMGEPIHVLPIYMQLGSLIRSG